ncbi:MAG: pyridoxal-dependent decarboxylase [Rhizobiaceae bacterium]
MESGANSKSGLPAGQWPNREERLAFQSRLSEQLAKALDTIQTGPAAPQCTPAEIHDALSTFDFDAPISLTEVTASVVDLLKSGSVHMMHPGYFGLFNPSVTFPGLVADQITSTINPQLAVWSHAPAAVEIERHTVEAVAGRFGWPSADIAGHIHVRRRGSKLHRSSCCSHKSVS